MSTISRSIGFGLFGLLLICGTVWGAAIQGDVKGPDGKAVKGADVRIDRKDKSGPSMTTKTDRDGRYVFKNLEVGVYNVVVNGKGLAGTSSDRIKTRADGAIRIDFNLKAENGIASNSPKKKTHRVWVHGDTGSNIGGHYEDVADDGTAVASASATPGANNLSKANGSAIRGFQQSGAGGAVNQGGGN